MNVLFLKALKYLKLDIGEPRRLNRSLKLLNIEDRTTKISMEINKQKHQQTYWSQSSNLDSYIWSLTKNEWERKNITN